ncbi:MAG: GTPase Era [bacterium]|nr:GTPase Era [bacterium]
MAKKAFRSGYVGIIGRPNVGKSTLMNNLLHERLSIVTEKPQTTRHRILGILNNKNYQIIFLDTPGILQPKCKLQEVMIKTAYRVINDADLILFMVEPFKEPGESELTIINKLKGLKKEVLLIINKIDLIKKESLLPLIDEYSKLHKFLEIVPISALRGEGTDELLKIIIGLLPKGEPFYPLDYLTDKTHRFFASEIIREKIFEHYSEEIPYSTEVVIDEFKEREGKKDYIKAIIYVEKESQKRILIGEKGQALKRIGQLARMDIESILGKEVYLELWVKDRKAWRESMKCLKEFGYV